MFWMLSSAPTTVIYVISWLAPWRIIKDFDQLENKDKNGWPVKLKRIKFFLLVCWKTIRSATSDPRIWTSSMYLCINVICIINAVTGKRGVWRWGWFILLHFSVDNVFHCSLFVNQIKDICGIICAAMTWFLIFFAGMWRWTLWQCDTYVNQFSSHRIRCNGGNITAEPISSIQSNQHGYI